MGSPGGYWTGEGLGASHEIRLEALIDGEADWIELATFTWWAPPSDRLMLNYIAHRNEPPSRSDSDP